MLSIFFKESVKLESLHLIQEFKNSRNLSNNNICFNDFLERKNMCVKNKTITFHISEIKTLKEILVEIQLGGFS